jgi:hypothetical protein
VTSEKPHSKKGGVVGKLSWRVDKLLIWGFATSEYDNKSVNQNGIVSAYFIFFDIGNRWLNDFLAPPKMNVLEDIQVKEPR